MYPVLSRNARAGKFISLRQISIWVLLPLFVLLLISPWLHSIQLLESLGKYLPFHTALEALAVAVALMLAGIAWHTAGAGTPLAGAILASSFVAVALFDLSHVLSYQGMPDFLSPNSAEKTIYFWLAARITAAVGLLLALLSDTHRKAGPWTRVMWLVFVLIIVISVHLLVILSEEHLPRVFNEQSGLTPLKNGIEYLLVGINLLCAGLLWRQLQSAAAADESGTHNRPYYPIFYSQGVFCAVLVMAMSGLWFTWYESMFDINLVLGHVYKIIAYLMLFRAVFIESIERPYLQLQDSDRQLRLAAVAFETQVAIMVTDASQRILKVNKAFSDITGFESGEVIGKTPRILSSGMQSAGFYREMYAQLDTYSHWEGEIWNRRKSGEVYPEHLNISVVRDRHGNTEYYVANFGDLTMVKQAEERIHTLAYYDSLTNLANRRFLLDHLTRAQAVGENTSRRHFKALLFVDLDNFKALNDSQGHATGDLLLKRAAERLQACVRESDTVARPGGDEFAVLLEHLSDDLAQAAKAAQEVAGKVLDQLSKPYFLNGYSCITTASIGLTLFNNQEQDREVLLSQAEIAMYAAKAKGGNSFSFFAPVMHQAAVERSKLEADLRIALTEKQFELYYQVKVDAHGAIKGYEALIRWHHPERGMVSPVDFIPIAEATGLINVIGLWVIQQACAQLASWATEAVKREWSLSINISERQFASTAFADDVEKILHNTGASQLPAGKLEFEITETLLMQNLELTVETIRRLNKLGIAFSMDDFGTGYSSLNYLKMLPLDAVKVDQAFVRDMLVDRGDAAIVEMVIALAKTLDLKVVAEGVESIEQHKMLVSLGCDLMQGYLYNKPAPIEKTPSQSALQALLL